MKTKWLLETDVFHENLAETIIPALKNQNIEFIQEKYIPFDENKFLNVFDDDDCVIFYGSLNFAKKIRRNCKWVPGLYHTIENYDCTNYFPYLGEFLFNTPYIMLPAGELERMKSFLFETLSHFTKKLFIRPSRGEKIWTGQAVSPLCWEDFIRIVWIYDAEFKDLAVVSPFKNISREWRLVVANKEVITSSQYKPICEKNAPSDVIKLAEKIIKLDFEPDKVWTIDICEDMKSDLYLLEIGGFSCAGLYHCDTDIIVEVVSDIAIKDWEEYNKGK